MLRSSFVRRTVVLAAAAVVALAVAPAPVQAAPAVPTQLNAADMALLNGVRQAGLWEIPAGQMAAQKGSTGKGPPGRHHDRRSARATGSNWSSKRRTSSARPSRRHRPVQQQGWLTEMQNAKSIQFDQTFVTRLRAAHGKIFPVIGAVRASTRNPVVRQLADQANIFVMNHMKMLESTGLVQLREAASRRDAPGAGPVHHGVGRSQCRRVTAGQSGGVVGDPAGRHGARAGRLHRLPPVAQPPVSLWPDRSARRSS